MQSQVIQPFDLVIFGGSGDLARRMLLPALYYRHRAGQLPQAGRIIGLGRRDMSCEQYRGMARESCERHVERADFSASVWESFAQRLDYLSLDASQANDYALLSERLTAYPDRVRVFYLATTPELFSAIGENLAAADLIQGEARVVIEKPLGRDLASAQRINDDIGRFFREDQIFRIDHYLGKETVQNLMALRFGNALLEPLWRREWVRDVQITLAEQIGVEGRGEFYDRTGATRDMVQNHLLQLLCIIAMEPPISIETDAVRDEKLKVLRTLKPLAGAAVIANTVRGQYRAGAIDGRPVKGFLDEDGIDPGSHTETFVALKAELEDWRWANVPFYLRTGKRLQEKVSEIVVNFRSVPHSIFETRPLGADSTANCLIIRLQPDESVKLMLMAKAPGDAMRLRHVHLDLDFAQTYATRPMDAYERLLMDVIRGKLALFMRRDEQEEAWRWIDPIIETWETQGRRPKPYTAGTWGPAASSALTGRDGSSWHEES
jgi:glucose-6-phosphate 1-dehydrogenase